MYRVFRNFFAFCSEEDRKKFYKSIVLGVISALFGALKILAIGVLLMAILEGEITSRAIWLSLVIMIISVLGASIINYHSTMLQTEAGYGTAANKRMEIAEHMRYLPMGFFNKNSIGMITSVTTNTMENLADVGTRVVMLVTEGMFTTMVVTLMLFVFDWRIGCIVVGGLLIYIFVNMRMQKASQNTSAEKVRSDSVVVEKVLEYIKGISEVKAFHLSGKYNKNLEKAVDDNVNANIGMELRLIPYMTLQNFVAKIIGLCVVIASLWFYTNGSIVLLD